METLTPASIISSFILSLGVYRSLPVSHLFSDEGDISPALSSDSFLGVRIGDLYAHPAYFYNVGSEKSIVYLRGLSEFCEIVITQSDNHVRGASTAFCIRYELLPIPEATVQRLYFIFLFSREGQTRRDLRKAQNLRLSFLQLQC